MTLLHGEDRNSLFLYVFVAGGTDGTDDVGWKKTHSKTNMDPMTMLKLKQFDDSLGNPSRRMASFNEDVLQRTTGVVKDAENVARQKVMSYATPGTGTGTGPPAATPSTTAVAAATPSTSSTPMSMMPWVLLCSDKS